MLDGSLVKAGQRLVGIASSGPHSNGYSLIRRILARAKADLATDIGGISLGDALMAPTRLYVKPVLGLLADLPIAAMAHITGGGITENIIRVVPDGLGLQIDGSAWPEPPVFQWLMQAGAVARSEMWRTFNCGIGFVLVLPEQAVADAIARLAAQGLPAWDIGVVVEHGGEGDRVRID